MGTRALRQHYEGIDAQVDADLCPVLDPWIRHRRRFVDELQSLTDEQWHAPTRCTAWDVKDVVAHIASADGFWIVSLGNARAKQAPTTYLEGFDPSTSLEPFVDAMRPNAPQEVFDQFAQTTEAFIALLSEFDDDGWRVLTESPLGHLESRFIFGHAFWDSWLHERDIFVALDAPPPVVDDELLGATWFSCLIGGLQGGLLEDPSPVGPGLARPVDVRLRFDDLRDAIRVTLDKGVYVGRTDPATAEPAGSALDFVERFGGRRPAVFGTLPDDELTAHFERAAHVL